MNIHIPLSLLPSLLFIALCVVPTFILLWTFKKQTARKKSPLNIDLLRSPGESLNEQIQEHTYDILLSLTIIPAFSLIIYSAVATQIIATGNNPNRIMIILYTATAVGFTGYMVFKIYNLMKHRNHLRLGYDCELAVGQELSNRVRDGFFIFHDFPADGFNIDHVLVGSTGVFAIETKGRAKSRVVENDNWRVKYDGKKLIFPGWTEIKSIEQAKNQAQWLCGWLQKATGSPCKVTPVLAIPGWWIDRTAPGDMVVYNGKKSDFLAKGRAILSPQQIQAVSHQIDQKCRTVESSSYKQEE